MNIVQNRLIEEESSYDLSDLNLITEKASSMTTEQRVIFNEVIDSVENNLGKLFFIDGPGGTGKSFLLEQILANIRVSRKIAIAVASSSIAATLLTGGRTVHSRFRLPLELEENSTCNFSKQSLLAELLRCTELIIWDEAPMCRKYAMEAVSSGFNE